MPSRTTQRRPSGAQIPSRSWTRLNCVLPGSNVPGRTRRSTYSIGGFIRSGTNLEPDGDKKIAITQFDVLLDEPFVTALRPVPELERVLVEVVTDTDLVGVGEAAPGPIVTGETQAGIADVLETMIAPVLVGEDPRRTNHLIAIIHEAIGEAFTAKAAVDVALHDLKAKAADMPLYQLLGGYAEEPVIEVPTVLSMKPPDEMADDAAAAVDAGYEGVKIKLGEYPETDVERVRAVANAVPVDIHLKADANQGWPDAKTALRVLRACGEHLDLIEQPLVASDIEGLVAVRDQSSIPVMPDESVWSATDALSLVKRGAGDRYNIKLMKTGGLWEAGRLNAIAAEFELVGTDGTASITLPSEEVELYADGYDRPDLHYWPVVNNRMDGAVRRQIAQFADAVAGKGEVLATITDGVRAQTVAETARRAIEGNRPISPDTV